MSNGIVDEITKQLENNTMKDKEAIGFMLQLQLQIFEQLADLRRGQKTQDEDLSQVKKTVEEVREHVERYPSIQYMWAYQRGKLMVYALVALFLIAVVVNLTRPLEIWNAILSAL